MALYRYLMYIDMYVLYIIGADYLGTGDVRSRGKVSSEGLDHSYLHIRIQTSYWVLLYSPQRAVKTHLSREKRIKVFIDSKTSANSKTSIRTINVVEIKLIVISTAFIDQ